MLHHRECCSHVLRLDHQKAHDPAFLRVTHTLIGYDTGLTESQLRHHQRVS